jgi:KDO2-lipid IV(A) lauroyltransferase
VKRKRHKKSGKTLQHRVEYAFILLFEKIVCALPLQQALRLGRAMGFIAFSVFHIRRKTALGQLRMVFGNEYSERELRKIAFRTYGNFGMMVVEFSRFPVLSSGKVRSLVEIEGADLLDLALKEGKGAILVGGHFGNWELMGAALRAAGYPVNFLVGRQHNHLVDGRMNRYRQMMNIGIISRGMALRGVIHALRKNEFVAMLSDQDARKQGIFVEFLGRKASTAQGAALFARKVGSPIIVGTIFRQYGGTHRIVMEKVPLPPPTGDKEDDIRIATQLFSDIIARSIRSHPDHWFWMHRRWKTKAPISEIEMPVV